MMDTQIRETVEAYGTSKYIANESLLAAILDSKNIGKVLSQYPDIGKIINRTKEELKSLGLSNDEAIKVNLLAEIVKRIITPKNLPHISSPADAAEFLMPRYRYAEKEHFIVCCLNAKNRMTSYRTCFIGTLTNTVVHQREVFMEAIKNKAAGIVVAHNHPSGDSTPSKDDNEITKILYKSGKTLGIPLLDHIIIGDGCYYSYREDEKLEDGIDN